MAILSVNMDSFDSAVLRADSPVLVDFRADWCVHCRALEELLSEFARRPGFPVFQVDVDKDPALAARYGVSAVPTLLVFRDGKVLKRSVGLISREELSALFS